MPQGLSVSRLIAVDVNLAPPAAQFKNFNSLLILGTSTVIDVVKRMRSYASIDEVAIDFATTDEEYLAAVLWFEQAPQPTSLLIGRWAKTASAGQLFCGPLSAAQQTLANWTAITTGAFKVAVDGAAAADITGLDFSGATNLNGVASIIQTAMDGAHANFKVVWNANFERFEFTSGTTGASSKVSFLQAPAAGVDISAMLAGLSTSSGAYVADGIDAETALAAVTLFDQNFSSQWYGLTIPAAADQDHQDVAAYIEATQHIYGVSTQEGGVIVGGDTTDIAAVLAAAKYKRTTVQYSSTTKYSVCSLLGRILTTDWNANNSVITLMYKQEPGIVPESLNSTQIAALEEKNCNVFVNYNNGTAIVENGVVSSGDFLDTIIGVDWLANQVQTDVFNLLYTSTTKIPQTDAGNHLIVNAIEAACAAGVNNGLLAPGTWTSGGFGQLKTGDFLSKGYYVFAPPISQQAAADRDARKSVSFQVAAKLAGAIHTVDIQLNVNR